MKTNPNEQTALSESIPVKSNWILLAVCILGIMIQIDFTAVNVALIAMGRTLNADLNTVQWALSAYVLAWGAFVLTAGFSAADVPHLLDILRSAFVHGMSITMIIATMLALIGVMISAVMIRGFQD